MVQSTKLADQRDFANALFYGNGGTGKTTALAHMANLGRVLFIDAESGIKRLPLVELGVAVENIERLDFGPDGLTYDHLEDVFWSLKRDLDDDPDSWVGVALDSWTEVYHALLERLVARRSEKYRKLQSQGRTVSEMMADPFFIDRDEYGIMSEQVRRLIRKFRDLPCHFGTSFLERRDQYEDGSVHIGPSITPALQSDVIGWHDIVGRTTYDQGADRFTASFRPEGVREGKDRYGVLPRRMVDATFDRIVAYISGELSEQTDPRQQAYNRAEEEAPQGQEPSALDKARAKAAASKRGE